MSQAQTITCKCGSTYAACLVPECYQDTEWMKDVRKAAAVGHAIDLRDVKSFSLQTCSCEKEVVNKKQLKLF
jgi:malate/lactate dehydrogenase